MEGINSIYLSFDLDWVNDQVLSHTLDLLEEYSFKATFFATHESSLLKSLDKEQFEIGLHPNFETNLGKYDINKLNELKKIYPEASGMRSHTLFFSSRLLPVLKNMHLKYESNIFLLRHPHLEVVNRTEDIKSIPFNWSDDKHLELGCSHDMSTFPNIHKLGINVFNFHPIHVFLNTSNQDHYFTSKVNFNKAELKKHINNGVGIKSLMIELFEYLKDNNIETKRMIDAL